MAKRKQTSGWKAAIAAKFPPPSQYHWRAGPYRAPAVNVGAVLHDEYRGDVKAEGMTKAPIPWPAADYRKGRGQGLSADFVRRPGAGRVRRGRVDGLLLLGRDPIYGRAVEADALRGQGLQRCVCWPGLQAGRFRVSQEVRLQVRFGYKVMHADELSR